MDDYTIYPKQFRNAKIAIEKNACFVIMPFTADFNHIYRKVKLSLTSNQFICNRADEILGSKPIMNKILVGMLKAQYVIADLSGGNPNVFYELGVAHTFKDTQNIILLKQKDSEIPFDLKHLTYIEYDPNNIKHLTSAIKVFIDENRYISDFHEVLNLRGIINVVHDNKESFIDYLQTRLSREINLLIDLLGYDRTELSEDDVERLLSKFHSIIYDAIKERNMEVLPGILRVYYEVVVASSSYPVTEVFITRFLQEDFSKFSVSDNDALSWKTDLVLSLANCKKRLNMVIPWIIEYFSRTKSTTIDLNRYKIESFLMVNTYEEINKAIVNAVFDKNPYIREHIADIIGEKRLYTGKINLFKQLELEENFFTATSIISAIGKLEDAQGIECIDEWITKNREEIIKTGQFFILKHARIAISKLDITSDKEKLDQFDKQYKEHIENYYIL